MHSIRSDTPVFFMPNRVWRSTTGGALLDRFVGNPNPTDGYLSEDWLASTTRALNGEQSQGPDEGISRVRLPDATAGPLLTELLAADPQGFLEKPEVPADGVGVLCKFLDAAMRLPIQCHPDRTFARRHYNSDHGKTESWLILDSRTIDGEEPYLLLGFKPGINGEDFAAATEAEDVAAMIDMLHRVPARPGDVWFIPGRFPHAIGPGVFMLEVQEPSDWVVVPERCCAAIELPASVRWGPLDPATAMACFDYSGDTLEAVTERLRLQPKIVSRTDGATYHEIIGPAVTDCFCVDEILIEREYHYRSASASLNIGVVTSGSGELVFGDAGFPLRRGDAFLLPCAIRTATFRAQEPLALYLIRPGAS